MTYHETLDLLEGVGSRRHHLWDFQRRANGDGLRFGSSEFE